MFVVPFCWIVAGSIWLLEGHVGIGGVGGSAFGGVGRPAGVVVAPRGEEARPVGRVRLSLFFVPDAVIARDSMGVVLSSVGLTGATFGFVAFGCEAPLLPDCHLSARTPIPLSLRLASISLKMGS